MPDQHSNRTAAVSSHANNSSYLFGAASFLSGVVSTSVNVGTGPLFR